ncbi:MAG: RNA-binding transcriptional accessory protein [Myxococcota bacterium]|nr:RNA-binding transcriptional accessory protein [Myxococcota bacterium]
MDTTRQTAFDPTFLVATELHLNERSVAAVVKLLSEQNTVPFIARYRKEVTGDLDEIQIRAIEERHTYLVELEQRREAILASIQEQGKLTLELKTRILGCTTKAALEDLYLPYKPKRRTRATIAKERGLEPLALRILEQPTVGDPMAEAAAFINAEKDVLSVDAALTGARDIVAEMTAENADVRAMVREELSQRGTLVSAVVDEKAQEATKFKDYYDHRESVATIPSHRFLAIRRGEREGVLRFSVSVDDEKLSNRVTAKMGLVSQSPFADELSTAVADGYKRLLLPSVESDLRIDLKLSADRAAVEVFAGNLRNLLLAAPFGTRRIIAVDPGLRTGCKCTAIDETGKYLATMTFNLVKGASAAEEGKRSFLEFVKRHTPDAIAVGNGTAGRETEKFVREVLREAGLTQVIVIMVSEAGASVYSASELAGKEYPELDVTVRGAISIGHRLQDPLAELVKIDPKSIGVGQYQHDVHQPLLAKKLDEVVESCVNHVGVELNTASAPLLAQVAGIGPAVAANIVEYREKNGAFTSRKQLLKVAKLGPRTFEQAAGFCRIRGAVNPLDGSAVHPERYEVVERMAKDMGVELKELVGNAELVNRIDIKRYVTEEVGELTLRDIVSELKKPGRDPRDEFEPPAFREDVQSMEDLKPGMTLEGVVTNVTAFGAFVDVGVHQDGLVHVSQLSDRFIKEPSEAVKVGDKLKVRVLEVDLQRRRISLTAKSESAPRGQDAQGPRGSDRPNQGGPRPGGKGPGKGKEEKFSYNPFAALNKR